MKEITYNCWTHLHPKSKAVQIRVRWNNKATHVVFGLGVFADPNRWDTSKQCAIRATTHKVGEHVSTAREINIRISECLGFVDDIFTYFALKEVVPTKEEFKKLINEKLGKKDELTNGEEPSVNDEKSLKEIYDEFLNICSKERNWSKKVHCKYQQMWTHLTSCDATVSLKTLNKAKMQELKDWYIKNKYANRTATKQIKILQSFLRWSLANGYPVSQEAIGYKPNLTVVKNIVTFLNYAELQQFASFQFPKEKQYLDKARDLFVFMCYTSLRYSDLVNLRPGHIKEGTIEMFTWKTHDRVTVPLVKKAKEIIEKYKDKPGKEGRLFPVSSDEKMNDYLKQAAKLAGLNKEFCMVKYIGSERIEEICKMHEIISCHDARRTYICISLALGIPPEIVMKATGHSDYESMKPYIEVADETQALEMEKWEKQTYRSQIIQMMDDMSESQLAKVVNY